jgi:predicted RNA-binding protein
MMCLAMVYIEDDDGRRKQVMQDVAWIKLEDGGLQLTTLLGERRLFQAQIESINLMKSTIVLKRMAADPPEGAPAIEGTERSEGEDVCQFMSTGVKNAMSLSRCLCVRFQGKPILPVQSVGVRR